MWSLSLEEQFYFAFPLLFIAGLTLSKWNGSRNRSVFLCCAVLVSALSLVLTLLLSFGSEFIWSLEEGKKIAFYSPFSRAWEFGVGSVVALYTSSKSAPNKDRRRLSWVAPFGLLGILLSALLINKDMVFPGCWRLSQFSQPQRCSRSGLLFLGSILVCSLTGSLLRWETGPIRGICGIGQ